jgi:hypothetical protein
VLGQCLSVKQEKTPHIMAFINAIIHVTISEVKFYLSTATKLPDIAGRKAPGCRMRKY